MSPSIPSTAADVTSEWLSEILLAEGHAASPVRAIEKRPLGKGVGFLSSMLRCRLEYEEPASRGPTSLVVKLMPTGRSFQETAAEWNVFERELRFYQEVAPTAPIPVPHLLFGAFERNDAAVLVLEDLGHLRRPNQVHGIRDETTQRAVRKLAILQAHYWDNEDLEGLDWMPRNNKPFFSEYEASWPEFEEVYGLRIGAEGVALGRRLRERIDWLQDAIDSRPHTVVHGDFRADNILIGEPGTPQEVVILDWQIATRSLGALDPARLLSGSEPPPERRDHRLETFRAWHRSLLEHGVSGYEEEEALADFRLALLACLCVPVRALAVIGADAEGRGGQLMDAISTRTFAAALELGVGSLLD